MSWNDSFPRRRANRVIIHACLVQSLAHRTAAATGMTVLASPNQSQQNICINLMLQPACMAPFSIKGIAVFAECWQGDLGL